MRTQDLTRKDVNRASWNSHSEMNENNHPKREVLPYHFLPVGGTRCCCHLCKWTAPWTTAKRQPRECTHCEAFCTYTNPTVFCTLAKLSTTSQNDHPLT